MAEPGTTETAEPAVATGLAGLGGPHGVPLDDFVETHYPTTAHSPR